MSDLKALKESIALKTEIARNKDYLDITDVQLLTGLSNSSIRRATKIGRLKSFQNIKPNGKLLFKSSDVTKWIEGGAK